MRREQHLYVWTAWALGVAAAVSARTAHAQRTRRLELVVIDSVSGAPVSYADVRVVGGEHGSAATVTRLATDTTGHGTLAVADDESLLISIRRLGFQPVTLPVSPGTTDDMLIVALAPSPALLAPTITRAEQETRRLQLNGFYDRRTSSHGGTFLDSAAIAKRKPNDLYSLLKPYLHDCTMIYVDGMRFPAPNLRLEDVLAVEIYRSNNQAPPQFANPVESLNRCGSIVIWRRF